MQALLDRDCLSPTRHGPARSASISPPRSFGPANTALELRPAKSGMVESYLLAHSLLSLAFRKTPPTRRPSRECWGLPGRLLSIWVLAAYGLIVYPPATSQPP